MRSSLHVALAVCFVLGCGGPKGTGDAPTVAVLAGDLVYKHKAFFEARLRPTITFGMGKFEYTLAASSFPEIAGAALISPGSPGPVPRNGTVFATDVSDQIGAASTNYFSTISPLVGPTGTIEVSFFGGKQKVSAAFPTTAAGDAILRCLQAIPGKGFTFVGDKAGAATPPGVMFVPAKVEALGSDVPISFAAPQIRDIDWVALAKSLEPAKGRMCEMSTQINRVDHADHVVSEGVATNNSIQLYRAREEVTVYDRRTGATLNTHELIGRDECPVSMKLKLGEQLTSAVREYDRKALVEALRSGAPVPGTPSASGSAVKGKSPLKPGSKHRH